MILTSCWRCGNVRFYLMKTAGRGIRTCAFLNSKAQSGMISYRQYTTGIFCDEFSGTVDDAVHLLEIRLFNENAEIRASRRRSEFRSHGALSTTVSSAKRFPAMKHSRTGHTPNSSILISIPLNRPAGLYCDRPWGITRYRWKTPKSWRYGLLRL